MTDDRYRLSAIGYRLSAGCIPESRETFRLSDFESHCHPERKKGAAYVAGSSVYRYRRFIVKEKKRHRKWNHLKFVFSIFCGIMSIERDSWHPGEETALS